MHTQTSVVLTQNLSVRDSFLLKKAIWMQYGAEHWQGTDKHQESVGDEEGRKAGSGQKYLKPFFVLKAATWSTALGISRTLSFTK